MKKIKVFSGLVVFILLFLSIIAPVSAVAMSPDNKDYRYARGGSYFTKEKNTADLLSEMLDISFSNEEYEYLSEYGSLGIQYDDVTAQHISVFTTANITEIVALPYTYTADKGSTATWVPKSVTLNGQKCVFEHIDGEYVAYFGTETVDEDSVVHVDYELDIDFLFSKDDINDALNLAYKNAPIIKMQLDSARDKQTAHNDYCINNKDAIDKYYSDIDLYNEYIAAKALYDEEKRAYDEYVIKLGEYNEQERLRAEYLVKLDEYNKILDYNNNFDKHLENYNKNIEKYELYTDKLSLITTFHRAG